MEETKMVPANEDDIQERIAAFNAALQPLLGKYELGLGALPKITADGRVIADPVIVSMRQPVPADGTEKVDEKPAEQAEASASLPE